MELDDFHDGTTERLTGAIVDGKLFNLIDDVPFDFVTSSPEYWIPLKLFLWTGLLFLLSVAVR